MLEIMLIMLHKMHEYTWFNGSKLEKVDIVFLDLEMPKLDGYEVLVILKQHFGNNVPIVACTVHTAEINTTRKLGFSSFVAKPLDTDRFPNQLSRILNGDPVWEPR